MYLAPGKLQIHRLKIVKSRLSVHSTNAVQTAAVSIISYKPLSDLNFARDTIMYGSFMPSPSLGSISPWYSLKLSRFVSDSFLSVSIIYSFTLLM